MARSHRSREEVQARRELVYQLRRVRRLPWHQIATKCGVSESEVRRDLKAREKEIAAKDSKEESVERSIRCRNQAVATYDAAINEAWAEWERSKKEIQRKRSKARQKAAGKGETDGATETEAEETTEGRIADAQMLRVVVAAQTRIDEINGVDAPKKLEHDLRPHVQLVLVEEIVDAPSGAGGTQAPHSPNSGSVPPQ